VGNGDNQKVVLILEIQYTVGEPVELAPPQFPIDPLPSRRKFYYSFDRRGYFEQEVDTKTCLRLVIANRFP
jgi:hypothetical protein